MDPLKINVYNRDIYTHFPINSIKNTYRHILQKRCLNEKFG